MTPSRKRAIEEDEIRLGRRRDRSHRSLRRTLRRGNDLVRGSSQVVLETDKKLAYVDLARECFGARRLVHRRTSSKLARTNANPLFPINHTEAMARDLMGRLRRRSWLASKKRRYLDLALHVFISYRNLVRLRFNFDEASPAQMLGFAPRRLTETEVLGWRQDWAGGSIHPIAGRCESVGDRLGIGSRAA